MQVGYLIGMCEFVIYVMQVFFFGDIVFELVEI